MIPHKAGSQALPEQVRALTQCHSNRLTGLDSELLGRNGFGEDDTGTFIPISANC